MNRNKICILVLSNISNDPRVRRQCEAFHGAGWHVVGIGLNGHADELPCKIISIKENPESSGIVRTILSRVIRISYVMRVHKDPRRALDLYWSPWWSWWREIRAFYEVGKHIQVDVWLANDWYMLPLAARLAAEYGGVYTYDSHEYAAEEFPESWRWRILHRPMIRAIEHLYVKGASRISTVSHGISVRLQQEYELNQPPLVIRNTPPYQKAAFRPTGNSIKVLYHGGLSPNRGLEQIIESVSLWRSEFSLVIRGIGRPQYVDDLQQRIEKLDLTRRIKFLPPVVMKDLVQEAQHFDIGIHALPQTSTNNKLALPNKFFEYIMAGLALCVTDCEEMSALIHEYGLGIVFPKSASDQIARAINAFSIELIDDCKRNALVAAKQLNWDHESQTMLQAYKALVEAASTEGQL